MAFIPQKPYGNNSMDRVSYIKPTSELGSGYIPFSVGTLNITESLITTPSGAVDLGSDANKAQRVWSDNAYFGGNEGKLIFDGTQTLVNGATGSNHAMVVRTSGYQDGIHIEYSPDTAAARRGVAGALRIHNRHYVSVTEGEDLPTYSAYGRTAMWVDNNGNNCWGLYMLNNLTDTQSFDTGADDKKGVFVYGSAGGEDARGLLVEHNNTTVGSVGAEFKNTVVSLFKFDSNFISLCLIADIQFFTIKSPDKRSAKGRFF